MNLEDLMKLVDEYAEQRHKTGDYTYSQNTLLKRVALQEKLLDVLDGYLDNKLQKVKKSLEEHTWKQF